MGAEHCDLMYRLQRRLGVPLRVLAAEPFPHTFGELLDRACCYSQHSGKSGSNPHLVWRVIGEEVDAITVPVKNTLTALTRIDDVLSPY